MKTLLTFFLLLVAAPLYILTAQVKAGDNPNLIDSASLLELESKDKVLVVTRITTAQMNTIIPLHGALIYNTDEQCLFQFKNGAWSSLCSTVMSNETITSLNDGNDGTIIHVNEAGLTSTISKATLVDNGNGTFTFSNNNGNDVTISVGALETLTQLTDERNGTYLYTNEQGNIQRVDTRASSNPYNNTTSTLSATNVQDALDEITTIKGSLVSDDLIITNGTDATLKDVNITIAEDAIGKDKINADLAGTGLTQAADGALEVDVSNLSGDGSIASPNGTITLTGIPTNATLENVGLDVDVSALTGDGSIFSPNNSLTFTGTPTNALFDNVGLDVNVSALTGDGSISSPNNSVTFTGTPINALFDNVGLDVNVSALTGDGSISSPNNSITLTGTPTNALFDNVGVAINTDNTTVETDPVFGLQLKNDGITNAKIADNAINTENIADGQIQTADIANNNITTAKILDKNITPTKIQSGASNQVLKTNAAGTDVEWGMIDATSMRGENLIASDSSITVIDGTGATLIDTDILVATDGITNEKVADNAINTENITDGQVQTADIDDDAITTAKILNGTANHVLKTNGTGTGVEWGTLDVNNFKAKDLTAGDISISVNGGKRATLIGANISVAADGITNEKIADNAINTENITDGQVQTADIADDNVTTAKVLDKNITPSKIQNGSTNQVLKTNAAGTDVEWGTLNANNITGEDLTAGDTSITVTDGAGATLTDANVMVAVDGITNAKIADNAINTENIMDGQVQTADIADDNVTTAKVLDKNITPSKIQNGSTNQVLKTNAAGTDVEWGTLNANNITGEDLTAGDTSITVTDGTGATLTDANVIVAADGITNEKIADNAINTENITDGQVQTADIADDNITTVKILDANVTTAKIADNNVTTAKILDANVTTTKIADNNITTAKVLDKNITPSKIQNGSTNQVLKTNAAGTDVEWGTLNANNITGEDLIAGDTSITITDGTGATLTNTNVIVAADGITNEKIADNAINTENITDGQVQTTDIADDNITTAKIADDNVTTAKILDANVTTTKIADDNITTAKVLDKNITPSKIQNGSTNQVLKTNAAGTNVEWGTLDSNNITGEDLTAGDTSITITDGTGATLTNANVIVAADGITNEKIADNAINTENITDGQVQTTDIADGNITTVKILDANVTTTKIADNNITTAKVLDKNITPSKIQNGSTNQVLKTNAAGTDAEWGTLNANNITGEDLTAGDTSITVTDGTGATLTDANIIVAADGITNAKIADNAINTENITDGQVQTTDIADDNITTAKIADDNVTTAKILDANVTTVKIADNNITTAKVLDKNITPSKIQNGSTNQVLKTNAAGTDVEWGTLDTNNITGEDLTSGDTSITITDGTGATLTNANVIVAADGITNEKIADNAVQTENILNGTIVTADIESGGINKVLSTDAAGTVRWEDKAPNQITSIIDLKPIGNTIGTYTNENNTDFTIKETITSLSQSTATGVITYNAEDTGTSTVNVVDSSTISNNITSGANGGAFYDDPDNDPSNEHNTAFSIVGGNLRISDSGGNLEVPISEFNHTGTPGSVFFAAANGIPTENNNQFFFDQTNTRLFLGPRLVSNINNKLNVNGSTRTGGLNNADGTVSLPSYRFTDDSNTGLYRPITDQIGIVTGGSEAIRIDASQRVGIGLTMPDESLHIANNMRLNGAFEDKDGDAGIANQLLVSTGTGTNWIDASSIETITTLTGTAVTGNSIGVYENEVGLQVPINETVTTLTGTGSILTYASEAGTSNLTRIVRAVNGVDPGIDGNVTVLLSSVSTGPLSARPIAGIDADIYVISGETAPNTDTNGITYIYNEDTLIPTNSGWVEITTNLTTTDNRYVNIIGDTMTGPLGMGANAITDLNDPVNLQDAATKNYVDNQLGTLNTLADGLIYVGSNSNQALEVSISGDASMDNTGVLTIVNDAIDKTKINGDIAGNGLTQAADGSLQVNINTISGDGSLTSAAGSIALGGTTTNALFENVNIDVNVDNTSIGTDPTNGIQIVDGGVTTVKLGNNSVVPTKVATGTANQILKTNALGTAVEWGFLEATNIDNKDLTAADASITITSGVGAVLIDTSIEVADEGISTAKLGADAVTNSKIANDAIQTENILNATILTEDIASGGNDKILTTSVTGVVSWTDKAENEITTITGLSTTGNSIGIYNNEQNTPYNIQETITTITDTNTATTEKQIATYTNETGSTSSGIFETVTDLNDDNNIAATNTNTNNTGKRVLAYEDENGLTEEYTTSITGQSFDENTDILTISEGIVNTELDLSHLGNTWIKQGTTLSADVDDTEIYKNGTVGIGDFSAVTIDANLHIDGTGTLIRAGSSAGTKIDLMTAGDNTTIAATSTAGTGTTTITTDGGDYIIKGSPTAERGQLQMKPYENENSNLIVNKVPQAGLAVETDGDVVMVPVIYATGKVSADGITNALYNATVVKGLTGSYRINFSTPLDNTNYIIQLTVLDCGGNCPPAGGTDYDDPSISYFDQNANGFNVSIGDNDNGGNPQIEIDQEFMFTVIRLPGLSF